MAAQRLDCERVRQLTFVRHVRYLDQVGSTSDVALEEAERAGADALPLLVVAERQVAGRGRGRNRWWSGPGSLAFSLLLDASPDALASPQLPLLSLTAGVAVCRAVQRQLPDEPVGLKWPNDVHLRGRKVCGILVEVAARSRRAVVGIGVNVNNRLAEAPDELQRRAIALADVAGRELDRTACLVDVLGQLERQLQLLQDDSPALADAWQSLSVLTGRLVHVRHGAEEIIGWCEGIDRDGSLLVRNETTRRRCLAGVAELVQW